ncbi:MAG: glycosyltransferase family 1 protein [Patescibacteria group bacterium]
MIAIDLRPLRGVKTGVGEYTEQLARALVHQQVPVVFFSNGVRRERYNPPLPATPFVHTRIPNKLFDLVVRYFQRPKIDACIRARTGVSVAVFLSPHITSASVSRHCRKVVILHDCSFRYRHFFSFKKQYWHWSMAIERTLHTADLIITVSESTRQQLLSWLLLDPGRVRVVALGIEASFFNLPSASVSEKVRSAYRLPVRFILFLGTREPRKNLRTLLDAFTAIATEQEVDLVIAGQAGWRNYSLNRAIARHPFHSRIHQIGYVAASDKNALYRLSSCFCYPSLYEGFGFPPLEALACGVPTVVSASTSLPEVVGSCALTVDPYNSEEIARAVLYALRDRHYRERVKAEGPQYARQFQWDKTAEQVMECIEQVA